MYLTRPVRVLCWITAVPLLLVTAIFARSLIVDSGKGDASGTLAGMVLFLVFSLVPTIPLSAYYFSGAFRKRYQRDVLGGPLHLTAVAEKGGVQWSLMAFPDRLAAPGVVVVAVFLQNAHSTPRAVSISFRSNPFERGGLPVQRHRLLGGEAGVLRIPIRVPGTVPASKYELQVDIESRREGRIGARTIRRDGWAPRRLYHSRVVDIEVLGKHEGLPTNELTLEWTPFQRLFGPGQEFPDLEPIRVLESL